MIPTPSRATRRALALSVLLAGCHGKTTDTGAPTGDGGAADTGDTGSAEGAWTPGPDLPDCEPATGDGDRVALSGVVLTPDGPEAGLVVYSRSSGRILCVGHCDPTAADVVCTEGVIGPGLIDAHDHMQYDVLPPWQHDGLFSDRYDWQSDGDYWDYRTPYDAIVDDWTCEIVKWAELRELVSGATSAVGASGGSCIDPLIRNLDEGEDAHFIDGYDLYYSSSKVMERYDEADGAAFAEDLADGTYEAVLNHVAEGVGGSVTAEIEHMFDIGMAGPGEEWIHATDATTDQLARAVESGAGIIWSPRSNLDLYGATTPADVAMRLGVPVALGPDWTWSGSMNMVHEMRCATEYLGARGWPLDGGGERLDERVWHMATDEAARAVGLDGVLGSLQAGLLADIAVYDWSAEPYRAIIEAEPQDVRLVLVAGQALYGLPELVEPLAAHPDWCETLDACGATRTACVQAAASGDDAWTAADIEAALSTALGQAEPSEGHPYSSELLGLWLCDEAPASCDPGEPADGDADGDGIADADDGCPEAWDPDQPDHDGDGLGDACDPCPDDSNADGAGCPTTIQAIRDPDDPDHIPAGTAVTVSGAVVTGVRAGNGFYVQQPGAAEYGGLYVYDGGAASVAAGDVVSVAGTADEYYGLTEITDATTTVTGSAALPDPVEVAPCDAATGGSLGEPLEAMLVVVRDVEVTDENPDDPDDYGEFEVGGCLRVDDELYDGAWSRPAEGATFSSITGVLTFRYGERKLVPRDAGDLVE